jgi:hypothetical protein
MIRIQILNYKVGIGFFYLINFISQHTKKKTQKCITYIGKKCFMISTYLSN